MSYQDPNTGKWYWSFSDMMKDRKKAEGSGYMGFDGGYGGDPKAMPEGLSKLEQLQWKAGQGQDLGINSVIKAAPAYDGISVQTPNGMALGSEYQMGYGGLDSFNKMKSLALGRGPSSMYKDTSKAIDLNRTASLDQFGQQSNAALGGAMSGLAATGGFDAGSRERMTDSNALSRMVGTQGIYAGADQQRAGALMQDNQMKTGMLSSLAGYDAQARQMNVNNLIADRRGGNMFDLERWGKIGDIIGSGKTADAMQSGKSDAKWYEFWK